MERESFETFSLLENVEGHEWILDGLTMDRWIENVMSLYSRHLQADGASTNLGDGFSVIMEILIENGATVMTAESMREALKQKFAERAELRPIAIVQSDNLEERNGEIVPTDDMPAFIKEKIMSQFPDVTPLTPEESDTVASTIFNVDKKFLLEKAGESAYGFGFTLGKWTQVHIQYFADLFKEFNQERWYKGFMFGLRCGAKIWQMQENGDAHYQEALGTLYNHEGRDLIFDGEEAVLLPIASVMVRGGRKITINSAQVHSVCSSYLYSENLEITSSPNFRFPEIVEVQGVMRIDSTDPIQLFASADRVVCKHLEIENCSAFFNIGFVEAISDMGLESIRFNSSVLHDLEDAYDAYNALIALKQDGLVVFFDGNQI